MGITLISEMIRFEKLGLNMDVTEGVPVLKFRWFGDFPNLPRATSYSVESFHVMVNRIQGFSFYVYPAQNNEI